MGHGISYRCKKCGEEKRLMLGVGFIDYKDNLIGNNFNALIEISKENNIVNLEELLDFVKLSNVDMKEDYGHEPYICTNCGVSQVRYKYELTSGKNTFVPKYKCSYCDSELRLMNEKDEFKFKCDKCGGEEFEQKPGFIMWD